MTRIEYIQNLMETIFEVSRISYDGELITPDKNILPNNNKIKSREQIGRLIAKYQILFELAFLYSNTFFELKKVSSQETALKNALKYLENNGVCLSIIPITQDNVVFHKEIIYKAIAEILIPAILKVKKFDYSDTPKESEEIDEQFAEAIHDINKLLYMNSMQNFEFNDFSQADEVVDPMRNKSECNTDIPIEIEYSRLPEIVRFNPITAYAIIKCNPPIIKPNYLEGITINKSMLEFLPQNIKSDYVYTVPDNDFWIDEYGNIVSDSFPVSNIEIPLKYFEKKKFIFKTYMDYKKAAAIFPEAKTKKDIDIALKERAMECIEDTYSAKFPEYYIYIIDYIEDILNKIFSIDFKVFIQSDNEDTCIDIIDGLNINSNYFYDFIHSNKAENVDYATQTYLIIERIITDFTNELSEKSKALANALQEELGKRKLKKHIDLIKDYFNSPKLDDAIKLLKQEKAIHPEIFRSEHTSCFQDAKYYKRSNTFSSLKSTLEKYYEYLTDDK